MAPRVSSRKTGLARALSKLGYCSRSQAFGQIRGGTVSVNGVVRRDPEFPVRIEKDRIEVNGEKISAEPKTYLLLNKPRGVVTTASDDKGRKTVYDLLDPHGPRVGPVGRLDKASEGLLLLTNDTEWAAHVLAPETHLDKLYHVQIGAIPNAGTLELIRKGIKDTDGEVLHAKSARLLRQGERNSWLEIILDEGKNRQIRRIFAALGIEVLRLVRVSIGPLELGQLAKGSVRSLTADEKKRLDGDMQKGQRSKA
ncbi:MAG TPA: pseudouridine synthase [Terriglobales bacterium]|nr:pseudouridine synthase [Terriglobales bacterium]